MFRMKKLLASLLTCLLVTLLAACQAQQTSDIRYSLLYTKDFATVGKQAKLAQFDAQGRLVNKQSLNGALYYNLLPSQDGSLTVDNGLQQLTVTSKGVKKIKFPELRGVFEAQQYVMLDE